MKKRLIKFITVIISAIIAIAGLGGCNLVTTNNERNLEQVVATVEVTKKEEIYKKDLVMQYIDWYYNQGGYMYIQYGYTTAAATYKQILKSLIENRIIVQYCYDAFENGNADAGIEARIVDASKSAPEKYLDAAEITEAKYATYKSVNDLLDAYTNDKPTEKGDAFIGDVRTIPTNAKNAEKDVDKAAYVEEVERDGFDVTSSPERRAAFNKIIDLFKTNDLLGSEYKGKITETAYFEKLLTGNYEYEIIENYEEIILKGILDTLDYDDLQDAYNEKLTEQKEWSNSEFVSALSSANAESPLLYSAYGVYGYVYNLLIGVNDYQSAKLSDLKERRTEENMTDADYAAERKDILAGTIAKDLRSSWILSGYDFNYDENEMTGVFTGDYTFAKNAINSLPFKGKVNRVREADIENDLSAVYNVESVTVFDLSGLLDLVKTYVYNNENLTAAATNDDIYAAYTRDDKPIEYDAKIQELLFAFSTDSGSLNTYKGYVIKPEVDGADSEEYVKTFGDAGRELLSEGGSSFKVVASDYGYHFMFFSEVWNANNGYENLDDYLATLDIDMGEYTTWEAYFTAQKQSKTAWEDFAEENNFLYILANGIISGRLNKASSQSKTSIVDKYRYDEKKVIVYESRISDLLGD